MDACQTEAWLKEAVAIEKEFGEPAAGVIAQAEYEALKALTPEQHKTMRRNMRIQSILFVELQQWMEQWGVGKVAFEKTYTIARDLIRNHLKNLTPEHQALIDALLVEDQQPRASEKPLRQQQVIPLIQQWFTVEDWQILADTAAKAVSVQVLKVGQVEGVIAPEPSASDRFGAMLHHYAEVWNKSQSSLSSPAPAVVE